MGDGRYAAAEAAARGALALLGARPALDRLRRAALIALGNVLRHRGRYREAEPSLQQALVLARRLGRSRRRDDRRHLAAAQNSLAILYKYTGRYSEAVRLYRGALAIYDELLGADSLQAAIIHHNLGGIEHARRRFARGLPHARRAQAIFVRVLGPEHPMVAQDAVALAALLEGEGQLDEAEAHYRRSLAIFERAYGDCHYEVAITCNNLASLQHARGHAAAAEALYRRALGIKRRLLGAEHPDVAITLNNLALLCKTQERYAEAKSMYQRALAIFESTLGCRHDKFIACAENLRALLREQPKRNAACAPRRQRSRRTAASARHSPAVMRGGGPNAQRLDAASKLCRTIITSDANGRSEPHGYGWG